MFRQLLKKFSKERMASNGSQNAFLVSSGSQTSDKQVQARFSNASASPWLQVDSASGDIESPGARFQRNVPVRSVSTFLFQESRDICQIRAAPFPSLPTRREVLEAKNKIEQEIQRLKAELSSLQHERSSFNRTANQLLTPANTIGIHEYRGLVISDNSINETIAENRSKKCESEKSRLLSNDTFMFKHPVELPYYRDVIAEQRRDVLPIFSIQFLEKLQLTNYKKKLAEKYVQKKEMWKHPNELIDEYGDRVDIKSENWPPEFVTDIPKIDDAMRLKWCAHDEEMILSEKQKKANCFYDMNGFVKNPVAAHNEYRSRLCWTDEEKNIFIEKYRQHPKNFRKIADALPEKTHKDVIEFYYLKRYEFNLKQSEAAAKRRGKKKVISEGSAKKYY